MTDAKKNLRRWLAAAARGEDIGIVCGADVIAPRRVERCSEAVRIGERSEEAPALPSRLIAPQTREDLPSLAHGRWLHGGVGKRGGLAASSSGHTITLLTPRIEKMGVLGSSTPTR